MTKPTIKILKTSRSEAAVMVGGKLQAVFSGRAGITKAKAYVRIMKYGMHLDSVTQAGRAGLTVNQCLPAFRFFTDFMNDNW